MAKSTIRAWVKNHLSKSDLRDINSHGADSGFGGITYTSDCVRLFDRYADEIWNMAVNEAEEMDCRNICEMISQFNRTDMLQSWDTFRNLMLWFAVETIARDEDTE